MHSRLRQPGNLSSHLLSLLLFLLLLLLLLLKLLLLLLLDDLHLLWGLRRVLLHHLPGLLKAGVHDLQSAGRGNLLSHVDPPRTPW